MGACMSSAMVDILRTSPVRPREGGDPGAADAGASILGPRLRGDERRRWRDSVKTKHALALIAGLSLLAAEAAVGQQRPTRLEIWDLKLGTAAADLPDEFTDYACGTNGGPPSLAINHWRDFRRCRPEPGGLREVYFRYDDELEYWAK